jgi:hypothetical protein
VDQEIMARAPHTGRTFVNDRRKVWEIMSNICGKHSCFVYIKPALRTRNGRDAYLLLFDHFLGSKNVENMASEAETKLNSTLYKGEQKRVTWETYVRIHTEQHSFLNGLKDVCKAQVISSPSLHDDLAATVEIYSTFIKHLKAENPQLNVSEISFARGKVGKNSYGKRHSTGISNVSNANVYDRFFEMHEYNALIPDQKNTLRLKRLKRDHIGKSHTGADNNNGKNNGKSVTIKSLTRSIAALSTKIDKFSLHDDNEDESSDE